MSIRSFYGKQIFGLFEVPSRSDGRKHPSRRNRNPEALAHHHAGSRDPRH